ncbi:MAG: DUF2723 domain-containing protein [Candidatus Firestonebacteria bacterium]
MKMKKLYLIVIVFFISFFVYLHTLCPTIYVGDSGELIAAVYSMGIAHPSGYPIFCIFGKYFSFFIPGNFAFKINVITAFFASFSAVFLTLILFELLVYTFGAANLSNIPIVVCSVITGLCFSFSRTLWSQAVISEVYTLNAFFVSWILYLLIRVLVVKNDVYRTKIIYVIALLFGLALSNHHSIILLFPVLFGVVLHFRIHRQYRKLQILVSLFLLGLTIYLYLPIRSSANPLIDWGNPENLKNMMDHIFRKQYGSISKNLRTTSLFWEQCLIYFKFIWHQFTPYLLIPIIIGIIMLYKNNKIFFRLFIGGFLLTSIVAVFILNWTITAEIIEVVEVFFIQSHIFLAIFLGFGIFWFAEQFKKHIRSAYVVVMLFVLFPLLSNYSMNDRSRNFLAYDYAVNILKSMPKNSILFTKGDNQMFPLAELQMVENVRTDIKIYDDWGYVFPNIYDIFGENYSFLNDEEQAVVRAKVQRIILAQRDEPIYYTAASSMSMLQEVKAEQVGMIYRVSKPNAYKSDNSEKVWDSYLMRGIDDKDIYKDYLARNVGAQYHYFLGKHYYNKNMFAQADEEFAKASATGYDMESMYNNLAVAYFEKGDYQKAIKEFKKAIEVNPKKPEIHWNVGMVYWTMGLYDDAISEFRTAIDLKPNYVNAHFNMALAYLKKGDKTQANFYLDKTLQINPGHSEALQYKNSIK